MKRHQLAINSISTGGANLEERLSAYHEAGFTHVEFYIVQIKEYLEQGHTLGDVRNLLDRYELNCIGGFEFGLLAFASPEEIAANQAGLVANAELLAALGATGMIVGTDGPAEAMEAEAIIDTLARAFAAIGEKVRHTGVGLNIEFNWSPVVKSLRTAAEIARRSGADNIGVLFDPAHYHCTPTKPEHLTPENIALIKHVHVDDMRDIPGELSNCNSDRALPGEGCLDLRALFGRIEAGGYNGLFSIEMFSDELWALPAAEAARRMYQSLLPLCDDA